MSKKEFDREQIEKFAADPRFKKRIADSAARSLVYGTPMDTDYVILQTMVEIIEEEREQIEQK